MTSMSIRKSSSSETVPEVTPSKMPLWRSFAVAIGLGALAALRGFVARRAESQAAESWAKGVPPSAVSVARLHADPGIVAVAPSLPMHGLERPEPLDETNMSKKRRKNTPPAFPQITVSFVTQSVQMNGVHTIAASLAELIRTIDFPVDTLLFVMGIGDEDPWHEDKRPIALRFSETLQSSPIFSGTVAEWKKKRYGSGGYGAPALLQRVRIKVEQHHHCAVGWNAGLRQMLSRRGPVFDWGLFLSSPDIRFAPGSLRLLAEKMRLQMSSGFVPIRAETGATPTPTAWSDSDDSAEAYQQDSLDAEGEDTEAQSDFAYIGQGVGLTFVSIDGQGPRPANTNGIHASQLWSAFAVTSFAARSVGLFEENTHGSAFSMHGEGFDDLTTRLKALGLMASFLPNVHFHTAEHLAAQRVDMKENQRPPPESAAAPPKYAG